ncbi:MAG: sigma-54 dependent transcriptional regulator [Verrucomicrobia bacterium]|nr:sigma-54 dependent transcriptional regulator [Verrucomicrobiota bacterium]MBU1733727.1 sigma-54 dependent transcriptional regulator [Verrucomicrobiota bacterium]MBU1855907.1 sigma-54 dependent transcriptional regulator [Verrucomicrobiota bacterium]
MSKEPTARILIIEDDPDGRRSVAEAMEESGYTVVTAATGDTGIRLFQEQTFDAVLSDIRLPDLDGHKVQERLRAINADIPVLLMTAYGTVSAAVAALKSGAYDYILKPLDLTDIQSKVAHAIENRRLRSQVSSFKKALYGREIIAVSPAMIEVLRQVKTVAATQATVLILGESGAGKELIARALHDGSARADGPFVAVNCGAFSESLLESELFGHEKGAFTGAVNQHAGAFERAQNGTLFLDEIGIAPPAVQIRLLRVLEEREIIRVGGSKPIPIDVRVISASNRNLDDLVAERTFRHDLLYRLQVVTIHIPPLRERREDIRPLADFFITAACSLHGRHIDEIEDGFYKTLERHPWSGNVRELKNAVESAVIMATTSRLTTASLNLVPPGEHPPAEINIPPQTTLAEIERQALLQSLTRHTGSRNLAAEELGISTRTIQRKIKECDLPF